MSKAARSWSTSWAIRRWTGQTHLFFQFISARYMKGSTIITSNRSFKDWVRIFASDEMAKTSILDRLFHKANIFNIYGHSFRLKNFN